MISAREITEIVRDPRISFDEAVDLLEQYAKTVASFAIIENTDKVYSDCIDLIDRAKEPAHA